MAAALSPPTHAGGEIKEPFPIYLVSGRYMLYDVNVVSYIRRIYHMCGCLIGTLPQIPQQNVFLGLPLELMVEETALLVEKGVAYIVDDPLAHRTGLASMLEEDKKVYLAEREAESRAYAEAHQVQALAKKKKALDKKGLTGKYFSAGASGTSTPLSQGRRKGNDKEEKEEGMPEEGEGERERENDLEGENDTSLFTTPATPSITTTALPSSDTLNLHLTPTASHSSYHPSSSLSTPPHLLPSPPQNSYPIYKHLHTHGYFLSPALRFGAKYMAYPGDPLRFHSHFVVNGVGWDEEIDVLDIVGGGRLGTGVKKGWMVGGEKPRKGEREDGWEGRDGGGNGEGAVRVFSVEWAGF